MSKDSDSDANACSAPEFVNLRVAKESIVSHQICADRRGRDSLYTSRDVPGALHYTEVADELVPGVRRSASHAQAQLRDPGDGQPFSPRFNHRPLDSGSADDVEWAAIGEVPFAPGFGRACPKPALKLRHLLNEKAGPVSAYAHRGPTCILRR